MNIENIHSHDCQQLQVQQVFDDFYPLKSPFARVITII